MTIKSEKPIRLGGRTLKEHRHICAFFRSVEEQNEVMMPFFKEGYDRGERLFHIVDKQRRAEHVEHCRSAGIDVEDAEKSGQLTVCSWEDAYLKDGYFDGDRMSKVLAGELDIMRERFPIVRAMGNMEWALEALPGVNDIVMYEAKLNDVLKEYSDPVVCVYDLNRHSASVVMDILRTHPMVIVGGVLQENPLYVPPEKFLEELSRRSRPAARAAV